tara:strand:+ start:137 stop:529 length:393 start_codon:yes stop_codon:yes gene_type:complete
MTVETASYISQLNSSYPAVGDPVGEGDDHLRLVKSVLKTSFPSSTTQPQIPNVSGQSGKYLTTDGTDTSWGTVSGGATGAGGDEIFYENEQNVTTSYSITANKNAMSAGPITVDSGATVTIPSGSTWVIV